jgi:hypothetical protein
MQPTTRDNFPLYKGGGKLVTNGLLRATLVTSQRQLVTTCDELQNQNSSQKETRHYRLTQRGSNPVHRYKLTGSLKLGHVALYHLFRYPPFSRIELRCDPRYRPREVCYRTEERGCKSAGNGSKGFDPMERRNLIAISAGAFSVSFVLFMMWALPITSAGRFAFWPP